MLYELRKSLATRTSWKFSFLGIPHLIFVIFESFVVKKIPNTAYLTTESTKNTKEMPPQAATVTPFRFCSYTCPRGTQFRHPSFHFGQTLRVYHLRAAALRQRFRFLAF